MVEKEEISHAFLQIDSLQGQSIGYDGQRDKVVIRQQFGCSKG